MLKNCMKPWRREKPKSTWNQLQLSLNPNIKWKEKVGQSNDSTLNALSKKNENG